MHAPKKLGVVFIHGTFTSHGNAAKTTNEIERRLSDLGHSEIDVHAHLWTGKNRHVDRHSSGRRLAQWLTDSGLSDVVLVGHSHGGNVARYTVDTLVPDVPNVRGVVTLGTPFLTFEPYVLDLRTKPPSSAESSLSARLTSPDHLRSLATGALLVSFAFAVVGCVLAILFGSMLERALVALVAAAAILVSAIHCLSVGFLRRKARRQFDSGSGQGWPTLFRGPDEESEVAARALDPGPLGVPLFTYSLPGDEAGLALGVAEAAGRVVDPLLRRLGEMDPLFDAMDILLEIVAGAVQLVLAIAVAVSAYFALGWLQPSWQEWLWTNPAVDEVRSRITGIKEWLDAQIVDQNDVLEPLWAVVSTVVGFAVTVVSVLGIVVAILFLVLVAECLSDRQRRTTATQGWASAKQHAQHWRPKGKSLTVDTTDYCG